MLVQSDLLYKLQIFLVLIALIGLPACGLTGSNTQPPRPTIVQANSTETPESSPNLEPTATEVAQQPTLTPLPTQPAATESVTATTDVTADPPTSTATVPASPTPVATATPTSTATLIPTETPPPASIPLESLTINFIPVADGFTKPLYVTHAGDGSGRLFVVEQAGRIFVISDGNVNPTPFLDIVSIVGSDANEQGLLSVAFHPDYSNNGFFFVNYTNKQGDTTIARYQVSDNPDVADPNTGQILLTIRQPFGNHNGGQLVFGPDGYLYIGMGDGGAAGDPQNNGQTLSTLLGAILRIDVNQGDPYGVPESNPFVNDQNARPEIWSYGWRNPWRFSFDRATNDMYIGDVGQNQFEEIDVEPAGTPGGQNYGWNLMEGFHCFNPQECDPASLNVVLPITEYDHSQGCSVTGGYVYRGTQFPALSGLYFYGDYCSGIIWGLRHETDGSWSQAELWRSDLAISSFGQDENGEVYIVNHQGNVFQIGGQ